MIRFIHLEKRFEKKLEALETQGEKGAAATRKTNELLAALTRNGPSDLKKVWKLTGSGEKRIEGCIKYDLGEGFWMICFRRGETLFISYVGDHDECQKYLDHFSGRHNWVAKENGTTRPVLLSKTSIDPASAPPDKNVDEDYDDFLMEQIDDKTLRKIFSGLIKNGKQSERSV